MECDMQAACEEITQAKGDVLMAEMTTLRDALLEEVKDLYDAEKQLVKALPKMAKAATSDDLRTALESHLEETRNHVTRLEQVFEQLDERPKGKHCAGIAGIIEEGSEALEEDAHEPVMDAMIIASGQRAEHYEIAAYGTVIAWAEALELNDVMELLNETLEEEKAADEKLTQLAEAGINEAATAGAEEEQEASQGARGTRETTSRSHAADRSGSAGSRRKR
jgi:ferritin-like metal-binding protein YciE